MSASQTPPELLDLQLLPAWVKEGAGAPDYSQFEGEEAESRPRGRDRFDRRGPGPSRDRKPGRPDRGREGKKKERSGDSRSRGPRPDDRAPREARPELVLPNVQVYFLPHRASLENVTAQIKEGAVAYSLFALSRLFLEKPERYEVRLTGSEATPLHRLGENGAVATDRRVLEGSAFESAKDDYYKSETVQSDPIKGNFSNVARCRASGTLLGPTNHHAYQPNLRNLYEQRFSRRMSFADYQRQVEIVSDPAVVEQWKEQARSVTTYTTTREETPVSFNNVAEAERHFRQAYLPELIQTATEPVISGVVSRRLADRGLGRLIENSWAAEIRSPSRMMQELGGAFREAGLNIFRHKRGMLFVTPIRYRPFKHDPASVSASVVGILEAIAASPAVHRKQLAESLVAKAGDADPERTKMTLASDLKWLISEGYVIEFNDGTLDLPRVKAPAPPTAAKAGTDSSGQTAEAVSSEVVAVESEAAEKAPPANDSKVDAEAPAGNAPPPDVPDLPAREPDMPEQGAPSEQDASTTPAEQANEASSESETKSAPLL